MALLSERELVPESASDARPEWRGPGPVRRARNVRRGILALFALILLLGATGLLGVRSATVSASGGGYDLSITYPRITRPGHASPWRMTIRHPGGFGDQPITVRVSQRWFDLFDLNGMWPDADGATADGEWLVWEFAPPDGDVLEVRMDTRVGPNRQRGASARTEVLVDDQPVVGVDYRATVIP